MRGWRRSGLTAREYAEREGLQANTLRWWASALERRAAAEPKFVEVVLPAATVEGRIELVVGTRVVRVTGEFDEAVLRRVLGVLEAR